MFSSDKKRCFNQMQPVMHEVNVLIVIVIVKLNNAVNILLQIISSLSLPKSYSIFNLFRNIY